MWSQLSRRLRQRQEDCLSPGVWGQPGQCGKTSSKKIFTHNTPNISFPVCSVLQSAQLFSRHLGPFHAMDSVLSSESKMFFSKMRLMFSWVSKGLFAGEFDSEKSRFKLEENICKSYINISGKELVLKIHEWLLQLNQNNPLRNDEGFE
jgi:hypothetical protein